GQDPKPHLGSCGATAMPAPFTMDDHQFGSRPRDVRVCPLAGTQGSGVDATSHATGFAIEGPHEARTVLASVERDPQPRWFRRASAPFMQPHPASQNGMSRRSMVAPIIEPFVA